MNSYWLNLPVHSIRNTGTFFEGLGLKVEYNQERQTVTVIFPDKTKLVFIERERFTLDTDIQWQDPAEYAGIMTITMSDEDEMRNLLHIAMLSGGEILREPTEQLGILTAVLEDYNGYKYYVILSK